jgi:hypothetical protein
MIASRASAVIRAAERVTLCKAKDQVTQELYGYSNFVLDEKATMRRVALFLNGTARTSMTPDEQYLALSILRSR